MSGSPLIQDASYGSPLPRSRRRSSPGRRQVELCRPKEEICPDWSSLPPDFLVSLSENLRSSIDYVRLRSVCRRWRSVVPLLKFPPLLLLPFEQDSLQFYDVAYGSVHSVPLDFDIARTGFLGSSRGWLFLIDVYGFVCLLNPFDGSRLELPKVTEDLAQASEIYLHKNMNDDSWIFISDADWPEEQPDEIPIWPSRMRLYFISEIILLASPADAAEGGGCLAVAVLTSSCRLAFCQVGDEEWKLLHLTMIKTVDSIACHGERLCAVDEKEKMVAVCRADRRRKTLDHQFTLSLPHDFDQYRILMPSEQELLMIGEFYDSKYDLDYEIYWCSLQETRPIEWRKVESLGKATMLLSTHFLSSTFLGEFHGCRGNAILFSDPELGIHGDKSGCSDDQMLERCIKMVDLGRKSSDEVSCNIRVENSINISWFTPSLC